MKIINYEYEVTGDNGLINSIKYNSKDILYNGKSGWKKIFPIIFPVITTSKGFEVKGKKYTIPRHGFWKDLKWETILENGKLVFLTFHEANDVYPFSVSIEMKVSISKKGVNIETSISNVSKEVAYFHFGYHPAFLIDESSRIDIDSKKLPKAIDLNGKLTNKDITLNKRLASMDFGDEYDTLVYKNDAEKVLLINNDFKVIVTHNAPNLQLWKPKDDMFICIEPWWGWNDSEYKAPNEAKDKKGIITLMSGKTFKATMNIKIENKK